MIKAGDTVRYAAIAGDIWDAQVTRVHSPVVLDLNVILPRGERMARAQIPRRFRPGQTEVWFEGKNG